MPQYDFSAEKNFQLIDERDISFEDVIAAISCGGLLDTIEHHDQLRYPGQYVYIVHINEYIYVVPFVRQDKDIVFLKTIFPSRKLTKKYLGGQHEKES